GVAGRAVELQQKQHDTRRPRVQGFGIDDRRHERVDWPDRAVWCGLARVADPSRGLACDLEIGPVIRQVIRQVVAPEIWDRERGSGSQDLFDGSAAARHTFFRLAWRLTLGA